MESHISFTMTLSEVMSNQPAYSYMDRPKLSFMNIGMAFTYLIFCNSPGIPRWIKNKHHQSATGLLTRSLRNHMGRSRKKGVGDATGAAEVVIATSHLPVSPNKPPHHPAPCLLRHKHLSSTGDPGIQSLGELNLLACDLYWERWEMGGRGRAEVQPCHCMPPHPSPQIPWWVSSVI